MSIEIEGGYISPADRLIEVVERKGIGHPDTVADGIAESISVKYSRYCLENFGIVLHHNVDKINVLGGLARIEWGSDQIIEPIRVVLNGRISASFGDKKIPVDDICVQGAKDFIGRVLPNLDCNKHVQYILQHTTYSKNPHWFNPRSIDDLPEYKDLFANDTSAIAAGAPLTPIERLVLATEGFFYDDTQKPKYPECGQDIKVMAIRKEKNVDLTVCLPIVLKYCEDAKDYWDICDRVNQDLRNFISQQISGDYTYKLNLNTQYRGYRKNTEAKHFYAVVGGSALDFGEEGLVGRGNNRGGIIPTFRTFSMEAAYGKNPVYHVGKVLGVVADELSSQIHHATGKKNEVFFVAKNGDPLLSPSQIIIKSEDLDNRSAIQKVVECTLQKNDWTHKIVHDGLIIPKTGNIVLKERYDNKYAL